MDSDGILTVSFFSNRCKDLASQNSVLHQHLESVSSQAARIRDAANASVSVSGGDADSVDDADTKLSELRSVVTYLRREKEIVDLQLELSKQENSRQKAQIEHLSQNLEDARKALSEVICLPSTLSSSYLFFVRNVNVLWRQLLLRPNTLNSWRESTS